MMQSLAGLLSKVADEWRRQGLEVRPGASDTEIHDFETKFHVRLPSDFAMYLSTLGGMPDGVMDKHLIRFWPLAEIGTVEGPTYADYFVFADYSISAHEYGIRLPAKPRHEVALIALGSPAVIVASNFTEFLVKYLSDPASIFQA